MEGHTHDSLWDGSIDGLDFVSIETDITVGILGEGV
jgi:hypothetical protein